MLFTSILFSPLVFWPILLGTSLIATLVLRLTYNVLFHPLRRFPGPRLWAASQISWIWSNTHGRLHHDLLELHKRYGGVVRIAPNELSYTTGSSWRTIYGHRSVEMGKDLRGAGLLPTFKNTELIVTAPSHDHARIRRTVAHAFSDKALREQEDIMQSYIDQFISRLMDKHHEGPQDLVRWYNYTTFDIMGDLSFGEPFGCLQTGEYHEWVKMIFNGVKVYPWVQAAVYYGLTSLRVLFAPKQLVEAKKRADANAYAKLDRRLARKDIECKDFMSYILRYNDDRSLSMLEVQEMAVVLIIAGSETTATFLSGFTYHLLRNPRVYKPLVREVRTRFTRAEDISILATQDIKYLNAVVEEAFRIYPPSPSAFPRIVPGKGEMIDGLWVPGNTTVGINQWAANHDPKNFHRPDDFLPERWLAKELHDADDHRFEKFTKDDQSVVQPFSFGPRACLGKNIAYAELRVIICKLLWSFDMELAEQPNNDKWASGQETYILWEKAPLWVNLQPVRR